MNKWDDLGGKNHPYFWFNTHGNTWQVNAPQGPDVPWLRREVQEHQEWRHRMQAKKRPKTTWVGEKHERPLAFRNICFLGGGFKDFLCSPLPGEMIQID